MVVFGAAGIKGRAAPRTRISGGEILGNRQGAATVPAKNGGGFAVVSAPEQGLVAGDLLVAMDTRVKFVAALESDGDDVEVGVVMRALSPLIDAKTKHRYRHPAIMSPIRGLT